MNIDIDDGEIEVLESSRDLFNRLRSRVVIEPHYVSGELSTNNCCQILKETGYGISLIDQHGSSVPLIGGIPTQS